MSPTSDVGRAESVCCRGGVAKSRGDHELARTRPCDNFFNKNDWVLSQHLWAQSERIPQHHSFPMLASSYMFFWKVTAAHQHRSRRHLCRWYHPTEEEHGMPSVQLAPANSKHHLILWTTSLRAKCGQKRRIECGQEIMLLSTHRTTQTRLLVTFRNDGRKSRIRRKVV